MSDVNNDKYYQETDDAQMSVSLFSDEVEQKQYQGASFSSVGRYASISHLSGRAYKNAQDKLHKLEREEYENSREYLLTQCSESQTVVTCKNQSCSALFIAKKADVKRGWGKFCSKSCKAQKQHWNN